MEGERRSGGWSWLAPALKQDRTKHLIIEKKIIPKFRHNQKYIIIDENVVQMVQKENNEPSNLC